MKCNKSFLSNPSRRHFLICGGMSASWLLLGPAGGIHGLRASTGRDYYVSEKDKLMSDFEKTLESAESYLKTEHGERMAKKICQNARNEFIRLLPNLPYIGGDRHPGTKWVVLSGH